MMLMTALAMRVSGRFGRVGGLVYAGRGSDSAEKPRATVEAGFMDEAGLAEIYQRYSPAIYAHCRRLLSSPAAARDATQEAFVRVMSRGPKALKGDDALRYLYRVATNVCLNQLREQRVHDRATPALIARSSPQGHTESSHADREFVEALLDKCDDTGTSIALMHYVDGMSQVEVADTLGITRRTVFNRLRKIERLARDLLGLTPEAPQVADETNEQTHTGEDNGTPSGESSSQRGRSIRAGEEKRRGKP